MSHLIQGDTGIQPNSLSQRNILKQVIAPRFKNVLRDHVKMKGSDTWKDELIISSLCKKLSDKQYANLRKQNANEIESKFQKLKTKLKKSMDLGAESVSKFFVPQDQNTDSYVKQTWEKMPEKINLFEKYNYKFVNFAEAVSDTKQINQEKQTYVKWLDHNNNSPTKSPNYCRMSFVLEKLQSSQQRLLTHENNKKEQAEKVFQRATRSKDYTKRRMKTQGNEFIYNIR